MFLHEYKKSNRRVALLPMFFLLRIDKSLAMLYNFAWNENREVKIYVCKNRRKAE